MNLAALTDLDLARLLGEAEDPGPVLAELERRDAEGEPLTTAAGWTAPAGSGPSSGRTRRLRAKDSYEEYLEAQYTRAIEDCAGVLLSKEGMRLAMSTRPRLEREIFTGPWSVAERCASEELKAWWLEHGRQTATSWRWYVAHDRRARRAAELVSMRGHDGHRRKAS